MAALGSLVVNLQANIAEFTGAMDKAAYHAAKRMEDMKANVNAAGVAIGAALVAGAGAFAVQMQRVIDSADETGKAAQKLGMTTEALSSLRYAADMSGVSSEQLSSAISKLNKAAADGNGAFKAMGVSVTAADGSLKSSDALLKEVAGKFSQYRDGAEKAALAQDLFGKSGADMIPLLNEGADGISALQAEAESLGIVLGSDVTSAAAAVNDNFTRMKKAQEGVVTQITAGMLPTIQNLTDKMVAAAKNSGLMEQASRTLAAGLKLLVSAGVIVYATFDVAGKALASVAAAMVAASEGEFKRAWEILSIGGQDMADSIRSAVDTVSGIWDESAVKARASAEQPGGGIVAPLVIGATRAQKARQEIDTAARDAARAQQRLMDEGRRVMESVRTPAEVLSAEIVRLGELLQAGAISWETYERAVTKAQDAFDGAAAAAARDNLWTGLMTEEESLAQAYERKKALILNATEVTEIERQELMRRLEEQFAAEREAMEQKRIEGQLANAATLFDGLAGLAKAYGGEQSKAYRVLFAASKAFSIVQATMSIATGLGKAQELGFPANLAAMAQVAAQGAAIMGQIRGTNYAGAFDQGGFIPAGQWGIAGERGPEIIQGPATVTSRVDTARMLENAGRPAQPQNIRIINAFDMQVVDNYLGSDAGEQLIMNTVRRNAGTIQQLVGG